MTEEIERECAARLFDETIGQRVHEVFRDLRQRIRLNTGLEDFAVSWRVVRDGRYLHKVAGCAPGQRIRRGLQYR